MRKGKILAEDSPQKLMNNLQVENLEDVFLKLCHTGNYCKDLEDGQTIDEDAVEKIDSENRSKPDRQKFRHIIILIWKNMLVYLHYPGSLFFMLIYPVFLILTFHLMLNESFENNQIGFVSQEIENIQECRNISFISGELIGKDFNYSCNKNKLSCGFLDDLEKHSTFSIVRMHRFQQL
jgi:hypothetical protein